MRRYVGIAAGTALVAAVLSVTGALPALAQGALKPLMALIVNDVNNPVPVVIQNSSSASATLLGPTKASQLVTLTFTRAQCPGLPPNSAYVWDQRVNADGSVTPFSIPASMVLVVTGLGGTNGRRPRATTCRPA
jgi:hypothetical protein